MSAGQDGSLPRSSPSFALELYERVLVRPVPRQDMGLPGGVDLEAVTNLVLDISGTT